MNTKARKTKKQAVNENQVINLLSKEEIGRKIELIEKNLKHADEFKQLHEYYTTRADNSLKKMQSLIVIECKLLRVIYTILKTGTTHDPQKLLKDIKRPVKVTTQAAA